MSDDSTEASVALKPWSGITKTELVISGKLGRRPDQSSNDYWIYLFMEQKKQLREKVVPVIDRRRTARPSKLIPVETVMKL